MITLDGVIQAPGGPAEDTENGFVHGGWVAPYGDELYNKVVQQELQPADYLLGRKTFEIWENYWPEHGDFWPGINAGTKYILSATRHQTDWKNTVFLNSITAIEKIKATGGADLHVWGSSELVPLLLQQDLVDEFLLKIHPVLLGSGKKLFGTGTMPAAFTLAETVVTTTGVIIAHYKRAGQVHTGEIKV